VSSVDHAIGRSRGGLTTKLHALVDGRGRPLVIHAGPGHAHDSPMLPVLLADLAVPRLGTGRPRTRPNCLIADKAYSSRAHRAELRRRGIRTVIPEQTTQTAHRRRRGSQGGRPVDYDRELYRHRNVIERGFNTFKQWRGLASRYDKLAINYRGGAVLRAIVIWLNDLCDTP
jgi:transposase